MYVCTRFDAVPYKYFLVCWWIQRKQCSVFARIRKHISIKIIIAIYSPMIYSAPCIIVLDVCISIRRASGRRLGPGNWEFFGPVKWHHHLGPKNSRFQSPTPSQVMAMYASKLLCTGLYRCTGGFMHKSPQGRFHVGSILWGWGTRCIKELNLPARAAQVHKGT